MLYLRMLIFALSFIGIYLFLKNKIKVDERIVLPITIISISICLYLFSIVSILKVGYILCLLFGIISLVYYVVQKEIKYKNIFNIDNIVIVLFLIYLVIITKNLHYMQFDNYSHWGLIVRLILEQGNLPKTLDSLLFPAYPPGTAVFITYFSYICNRSTDGIFIIAQNFIIISFLKGIYNLIKTNNIILKRITFFLLYLFMGCFLIAFNDLLVDSILLIVSVFIILCIYTFKDNINKLYMPLVISLIYLYLVKNAGLVLDLFLIMYFYKMTKDRHKAFIILYFVLGAYSSWNAYAFLTYGKGFLETKHVLNPGISIRMIFSKGVLNCIKYYLKYTLIIFNKQYISNVFFWFINLLLVIISLISKNKIKESFKKILKIDMFYILYFLGLGFVYVLTMSIKEANGYDCFDRYMMVPLIAVIFYLVFCSLKNNDRFKTIIYCICLLIGIVFKLNMLYPLIGIDHYQNSRIDKFNHYIEGYDLSNRIIGVYSLDNNDDDFLTVYALYKTRNRSIVGYQDINELTDDDALIVFDNVESIEKELINLGFTNYNDHVFLK